MKFGFYLLTFIYFFAYSRYLLSLIGNRRCKLVFELTEQQEMLRKTMKEFASKEIAPIAGKIDKTGEFPWECIKKLADVGVFGLLVPTPFGGSGMKSGEEFAIS